MSNQARTRACIGGLAVAALVVALASGCGSNGGGSSGGSQSAADFIRQVTTQFSRGQAGPLWDTLPSLRRQRLVKCLSRMIQSRLIQVPPPPFGKEPGDDVA